MKIIRLLIVIIMISNTLIISKDYNSAFHTITIVIPKTALLDIGSVTSKDISLDLISPIESSDPTSSSTNNKLWLDVTSITGLRDTRDITVKIDASISGLDLKVIFDRYSGSGFDSSGIYKTEITPATFDQILVSGIESGYTINGIKNGFIFKYIANSNNSKFGDITSTTGNDITVVYTLTN